VRRENGTRTAAPAQVKKVVQEKYEKLFAEKKLPERGRERWLETRTMKNLRETIKERDDTDRPIDPQEVLSRLKTNSKEKATSDGVPIQVYTLVADKVATMLAPCFNAIMHGEEMPKGWKEGTIYLILKPGASDAEEILEYRPITLLSVQYKLYTSVLNNRIRKVHEDLFSDNQGGFRPNRCTFHKLLTLRNIMEDAKENKKQLHIIYTDIKKAYDNIDAREVARTMEAFGYNHIITAAIYELGENITSRAITGYGLTEDIELKCGLRQGDTISPLLFLLFLEPLIHQLNETKLG